MCDSLNDNIRGALTLLQHYKSSYLSRKGKVADPTIHFSLFSLFSFASILRVALIFLSLVPSNQVIITHTSKTMSAYSKEPRRRKGRKKKAHRTYLYVRKEMLDHRHSSLKKFAYTSRVALHYSLPLFTARSCKQGSPSISLAFR